MSFSPDCDHRLLEEVLTCSLTRLVALHGVPRVVTFIYGQPQLAKIYPHPIEVEHADASGHSESVSIRRRVEQPRR